MGISDAIFYPGASTSVMSSGVSVEGAGPSLAQTTRPVEGPSAGMATQPVEAAGAGPEVLLTIIYRMSFSGIWRDWLRRPVKQLSIG